VRAPVSYGSRVRAVVAYLLGRQHIPNRRVAEAMADLFDLEISSAAIDSVLPAPLTENEGSLPLDLDLSEPRAVPWT
jgi:hypothetical protein